MRCVMECKVTINIVLKLFSQNKTFQKQYIPSSKTKRYSNTTPSIPSLKTDPKNEKKGNHLFSSSTHSRPPSSAKFLASPYGRVSHARDLRCCRRIPIPMQGAQESIRNKIPSARAGARPRGISLIRATTAAAGI